MAQPQAEVCQICQAAKRRVEKNFSLKQMLDRTHAIYEGYSI